MECFSCYVCFLLCSAIIRNVILLGNEYSGNISIYEALLLTLLGGCLSLTVTGIMRTVFPGISEIAFLAGPLPEELAKCLIVTIFLCRKKYNYGLQGILIGGAVGVGFSAMESAGYALQILILESKCDGHKYHYSLHGRHFSAKRSPCYRRPRCMGSSLWRRSGSD